MELGAELIILPYAAANGRSILHVLIDELRKNDWTHFKAAVAFARPSGNFPELVQELVSFANRGGHIDLTFGADVFSTDNPGSDYQAIRELVSAFDNYPVLVQREVENGRFWLMSHSALRAGVF